MWTKFHDNHSGGNHRERWGDVWIEGDLRRAIRVFKDRLGRDPVLDCSCECCGRDWDIEENAGEPHRGRDLALVIPARGQEYELAGH